MSKMLPFIDELKESGAIFYDFDGVMTDNRVLVGAPSPKTQSSI